MDGVVVVDKPTGFTSHDVVAKVRRSLGLDKVGHTGTLDPMATGVLPLVLGRGTKLAQYLTGSAKSYRATLRLGVSTDTLDAEGQVTAEAPVPAGLDAAAIEAALEPLRGAIDQVPPMYSAKKIGGKKLYQLARKGVEVVREAKPVVVHALTQVAFEGHDLTVDVTCSAGTYVRVLAQDIGAHLGCGAHLTALRRTAAGPFTLAQAVALEALTDAPELAAQHLISLSDALREMPRIDVSAEVARRVARGYQLSVADVRSTHHPHFAANDALAVGLLGGALLAVTRAEMGSDELACSRRERRVLKTERVLASA